MGAYYSYTKKAQNQGATFEKKKWHKVAYDDNYNNNKYETTVHTHFTNCRANTMTDSYIRSDVKC